MENNITQQQTDAPNNSVFENISNSRELFGQAQDNNKAQESQSEQKEVGQDTQTSKEEDWVIPGKFKTIEDVRKGYKETEKYIKQLEKERKELQEILSKIAPILEKEEGEQSLEKEVNENILQQKFYEMFEKNPIETLTTIADYIAEQKIADLRQDYHLRKLQDIEKEIQNQYPDFNMRENDELISEELSHLPEELRYKYPELALKIATREAYEKFKKNNIEKIKEESRKEGENTIRQKLIGATTISSTNSIPKVTSPEEAIVEKIFKKEEKNVFSGT